MINTSQPAAVNIDYTVQRVLVPISNIETASSLLELAWSFTRMPEASEDRKVSVIIPLVVLAGNLDEEADLFDDLTPILEAFELRGCPLVLRTRRASNVARGILDVANEENADLIVLGVHRRQRGEVELGVVVENVMATAPCDVAIFRSWDKRYDVKRVLIPNDGSPHARRAARLGVKIAQHYDVPAETIYIQDNYRDRTEGEKLLADSLEDIHPAIEIKRTVVQAQNPVKGLLTRVQPDDLLLLGYSQRSNIEKWLFGNFAGKIINEAETDVVLVGTPKEHPVFLSGIPAAFRRFFLMLTPAEQTDIVRNSYDQASPNLDYLLLIAISAALASLGLLVNSTAVVIGAMLVAPFMQPCIAFAVALTNGQYRLMGRALVTLIFGTILAIIVAVLCGLLVPNQPPTDEMLIRGNPTLLDALVAVFSGVMGAYATARKDIPTALAGVAIAAALMPPLSTFGIGLATQEIELGLRAGLLFLTNIVCITLAAAGVFTLLGMRPLIDDDDNGERIRYWQVVLLAFLTVPAVIALLNLSASNNRTRDVQDALQGIFARGREQVVQITIRDEDQLSVDATILTENEIDPTKVLRAQEVLTNRLGKPVELRVIRQQLVTAPMVSTPEVSQGEFPQATTEVDFELEIDFPPSPTAENE